MAPIRWRSCQGQFECECQGEMKLKINSTWLFDMRCTRWQPSTERHSCLVLSSICHCLKWRQLYRKQHLFEAIEYDFKSALDCETAARCSINLRSKARSLYSTIHWENKALIKLLLRILFYDGRLLSKLQWTEYDAVHRSVKLGKASSFI